jgi:hypothetical protein
MRRDSSNQDSTNNNNFGTQTLYGSTSQTTLPITATRRLRHLTKRILIHPKSVDIIDENLNNNNNMVLF